MSPRPLAALPLLVLVAVLAGSASATSLTSFSSCPRLLTYYHNNAIERASQFIRFTRPRPLPRSRPRVGGPRRIRRGLRRLGKKIVKATKSVGKAVTSTAKAPTAGTDFSDTNVQVEGVDEPDIIKTDGLRVFVVRGRTLSLIRTTGAGAGGYVASSVALPTSVREMVIEKDTLLLIGSDSGNLTPRVRTLVRAGRPSVRDGATLRSTVRRVGKRIPSVTVVYKVSAKRDSLRVVDTLRMQGRYISAREVGGVVRVVTTYSPTFGFSYPRSIRRGATVPADVATKIRATALGTWLPRYHRSRACGSAVCPFSAGFLVDCNKVYHPSGEFGGFGLLTVTTLRMTGPLFPDSTAVVSDGRTVYATAISLYVATTVTQNDVQSGTRVGSAFSTSFHKFALRPYDAVYTGSGAVTGSVLNQFSMHEHAGILYVATTLGAPWWSRRDQSKSRVTSFRQLGRSLREVGSVGNLGVGERIFAVRYIGPLAYVVTFRQVDPLYVLDIRNPARMYVSGELKIPGFSSYLHPIGDGKLLGVGRDATPDGRTTGAKVSLFDVSDVEDPRELAAWTLDGSYSSARWDHRAFLYWAPESVAVLPVNVFSRQRSQRFSGSILLKIDGNKITEQGRITQPECCGQFATSPAIERNFVLGRMNLWSLSSKALQVNDIRTLQYKSIVNL